MNLFKKTPNIMEVTDSKIKTTRRMIQENLDHIDPVRDIIERYQDKIYRVDFNTLGSEIQVLDKDFCVIPDIEADLCKLGIKFERSDYNLDIYYTEKKIGKVWSIKIKPMRYLQWGELE